MTTPTALRLDQVVITGAGVCSPLGHDPDALFDALIAGESALGPVDAFDTAPFRCRVGAQVSGFKARDWVSNRKNLKLMSPAVRYGLAALKRAWAAAGFDGPATHPERVGMFVGAGTAIGNSDDLVDALGRGFDGERFDLARFATEGVPRINPLWLLKGLSNNVLGFGTADLDARGVNQNYCNSAAGGLQAMGEAAWAIAEGLADVVVAGGADSAIDPAHFTGFSRLGLLTSGEPGSAVRPFDAAHDGFAPGEGAAFFVLEHRAHAEARGAHILGRIVGYGTAASAQLISKGDPAVVAAAARQAMAHAGWAPEDVDLIYAHGNATAAFDAQEAAGLAAALGTARPPVTTNKAQLGHAVAASGPLSVACALVAGQRGQVPGVPTLREPAPGCEVLNLSASTRPHPVRRALIHAAGLGGQTAFIALEVNPT